MRLFKEKLEVSLLFMAQSRVIYARDPVVI